MFKFFKKNTNISNNKVQQSSNKILSYREIVQELEEKFPDYNWIHLAFDECFVFIYRNIGNLKDTLIISSILRQIEPTIKDVQLAYLIDNQYVNNLITNKLPELRVLAYRKIDECPNEQVLFFPDFHNDFGPLYSEFVGRIEYIFEVRRNTIKILSEEKIDKYVQKLTNNGALLFLLNYLSIKDSLIMASLLNIIDVDEDIIFEIYPFEDYYLEEIFDKNISIIKGELFERIKKLEVIEPETSYFDYDDLCNQYKDLYERINDTLSYLDNKYKKR